MSRFISYFGKKVKVIKCNLCNSDKIVSTV